MELNKPAFSFQYNKQDTCNKSEGISQSGHVTMEKFQGSPNSNKISSPEKTKGLEEAESKEGVKSD